MLQKITYKHAAEILEVKYATIKNAVLYRKLTRCVSPVNETLLLREQVELFKGKRISEKALNLEEKALWDQYKKIAENTNLLEAATTQKPQNNSLAVIMAKQKMLEGAAKIIQEANKAIVECSKLIVEISADSDIKLPEDLELSRP